MLTIITATTGRPRQFALLEGYMARQTVQPDQWLVIGEDHEGYSFNRGQQVVRRDNSRDKPGDISLVKNYLAALPLITGDKILCVEDDDWFSDSYLATTAAALDQADLVGSRPAYYWHVASRKWRNMRNKDHASLTQTGFTRAVLPALVACCKMKTCYLDMVLWVHWPITLSGSSLLMDNPEDKPLMVGLKGIPWGCKGAGLGHDPVPGIYDPRLRKLRQWIGPDWLHYYNQSGQVLK